MENYLVGKCIKATNRLRLINKVVDGRLITISNFYIPDIYPGDCFLIKSIEDDTIILQNLNSDSWKICEVTLDDIEEFKIISKDSI